MIQRKETKTMNYEKPEVAVLGKATVVIASPLKRHPGVDTIDPQSPDAAYDLDE
jgi:hypothetical protein